MITTLYQIYTMYRYFILAHGAYVTYSFFRWWLGTTYDYSMWIFSFVYTMDPCPLQLEDRKDHDERHEGEEEEKEKKEKKE